MGLVFDRLAARWAAVAAALAVLALAAGCRGPGPKAQALIVYEGTSGDVTNVYTIDPSSGRSRRITQGTSFDGNPAWSPDRTRIIFSSRRDGQAKNDLYVMDANGRNFERLTDTPEAGEWSAKYSPDGGRIAYVREAADGWTLWVMRADGTDARPVAGTYLLVEFPAWAPGAKELYFAAIKATPAGAPPEESHIYSVDLATGDVRTRIDTGTRDACPHFSRDGKRLTYAATRTDGGGTNVDLFAHDLTSDDTTGATDVALTTDPARDDYGFPSPDDSQLVFVSDRDGNAELYLMNRDGSNQRRLTNTPEVRENVPEW